MTTDERLRTTQARVELHGGGGTRTSDYDSGVPATDLAAQGAKLRAKFAGLVDPVLGADAKALADRIEHITDLPSATAPRRRLSLGAKWAVRFVLPSCVFGRRVIARAGLDKRLVKAFNQLPDFVVLRGRRSRPSLPRHETQGRRAWMKTKRLVIIGLTATVLLVPTAAALANDGDQSTPTLVQQVRDATRDFRDVNTAIAAGYASLGSCVSGPQEGAMGVHYGKDPLDGELHADQPELLIYEQRGGRPRLVGVEYLVPAEAWTAAGNTAPPVLVGRRFQFVTSPNRYGLPDFYELHVWAWKDNPKGPFADWNPMVSCEEYTGEPGTPHAGH